MGTQGLISEKQFWNAITSVMGVGVVSPDEIKEVLSKLPPEGTCFDSFAKVYADATASSGMPGIEEFKEAFDVFDKDGDAKLSWEEFVKVFRECAPVEPPE